MLRVDSQLECTLCLSLFSTVIAGNILKINSIERNLEQINYGEVVFFPPFGFLVKHNDNNYSKDTTNIIMSYIIVSVTAEIFLKKVD